uniref:Uncharacterized protein n=3 Tax=Aegilops tauschii subsp. strangulata TaxID=200361 RepID=A0A453NB23_AEGTS
SSLLPHPVAPPPSSHHLLPWPYPTASTPPPPLPGGASFLLPRPPFTAVPRPNRSSPSSVKGPVDRRSWRSVVADARPLGRRRPEKVGSSGCQRGRRLGVDRPWRWRC